MDDDASLWGPLAPGERTELEVAGVTLRAGPLGGGAGGALPAAGPPGALRLTTARLLFLPGPGLEEGGGGQPPAGQGGGAGQGAGLGVGGDPKGPADGSTTRSWREDLGHLGLGTAAGGAAALEVGLTAVALHAVVTGAGAGAGAGEGEGEGAGGEPTGDGHVYLQADLPAGPVEVQLHPPPGRADLVEHLFDALRCVHAPPPRPAPRRRRARRRGGLTDPPPGQRMRRAEPGGGLGRRRR